ncbi:hypothetical protein BU120_13640, partial [Staphylococcus xylosus]
MQRNRVADDLLAGSNGDRGLPAVEGQLPIAVELDRGQVTRLAGAERDARGTARERLQAVIIRQADAHAIATEAGEHVLAQGRVVNLWRVIDRLPVSIALRLAIGAVDLRVLRSHRLFPTADPLVA